VKLPTRPLDSAVGDRDADGIGPAGRITLLELLPWISRTQRLFPHVPLRTSTRKHVGKCLSFRRDAARWRDGGARIVVAMILLIVRVEVVAVVVERHGRPGQGHQK